MSRARPSFPGDDPAVLCAAIEREVEFWGKLRRSQGSKPPRCTPSHALDYLFGGNGWLTPHALRRAEAAGLVAKADFGCGVRGWRLTRKGSALAQGGELLCRDCATAPSLDDEEALDRCAACAAGRSAFGLPCYCRSIRAGTPGSATAQLGLNDGPHDRVPARAEGPGVVTGQREHEARKSREDVLHELLTHAYDALFVISEAPNCGFDPEENEEALRLATMAREECVYIERHDPDKEWTGP